MKKRLLALCLAAAFFALLLTGFSPDVSAAGEFTVKDGVLTEYRGRGGAVRIPDGVTRIGDSVFFDNDTVTSVSLPSSVKAIGKRTFSCCDSLRSVSFNKGLTTIGESAFERSGLTTLQLPSTLTALGGWAFSGCESLRSAKIWGKMEVVGSYAFDSCTLLESVTMANSVRIIEDNAFANCASLKNLTLPNALERIGSRAFVNCLALSRLELPGKVSEIDASAFLDCAGLTAVTVQSSNRNFKAVDGVLYSGDMSTLLLFPAGKKAQSFTLPASVREILPGALIALKVTSFKVESGSKRFKARDGVLYNAGFTELCHYPQGNAAKEFTVPQGVKTIGKNAFEYAGNLTAVTLPQGLEWVKDAAFRHCSRLQKTELPGSVKTLGSNAFEYCHSLSDITLNPGLEVIRSGCFSNADALRTIEIPRGVESIEEGAFSYCDLLSAVTLPETLLRIEKNAFADCASLRAVTLPDSLKKLGANAFARCPELKTFRISCGVEKIESDVFTGCDSLTELYLDATSLLINADAFRGITLRKVYYAGTKGEFAAMQVSDGHSPLEIFGGAQIVYDGEYDHNLFEVEKGVLVKFKGDGGEAKLPHIVRKIGPEAFSGVTKPLRVTIPGSVERLTRRAFYNVRCELKVSIPQSVSRIDADAFESCPGLKEITIPAGVKTIDDRAFRNCVNLRSIAVQKGSKAYTAVKGALYTADRTRLVQYPCGAEDKTFTLPATVTDIGSSAFMGCRHLQSIQVDRNSADFRSVDGVLYSADGTTLKAYPAGNSRGSYTVAAGVTKIGENAFFKCGSLKAVTIPDGPETIGNRAFMGCVGLRKISLPSTVREIGYGVFSGCGSLSSVGLPEGLTVIGGAAFRNCPLKTVTLPKSLEKLDASAFRDCGVETVNFRGGKQRWNEIVIGKDTRMGNHVSAVFPSCRQLHISYGCAVTFSSGTKTTETSRGRRVTFRAAVRGNAAGYQWYYRKADAESWSEWSGHTSPDVTATANATWDGMKVFCRATDASGAETDSEPTTVRLTDAIVITSQPLGSVFLKGDTVRFSVKADGTGLQYQWYYKKQGQEEWSKWVAHTSAETSAQANDSWNGMQVRCVVTNAAGTSVTTETASLVLAGTFAIVNQTNQVSARIGDEVTVYVQAEGSGVYYQWYYKKTDQTEWSMWKGHTSDTESCTPDESWNGILLRCEVTDAYGNTLFSRPIKVNFVDFITILTQPEDVMAKPGEQVTFSVEAEGDRLGYQWYYRKVGQRGWNVWNGRTTPSTTAAANYSWNGMKVRCAVRNPAGIVQYTEPVTVAIDTGLTFTRQPRNASAQVGGKVAFSVKTFGNGVRYQWYFRKKGAIGWTLWKGHTEASVETTAAQSRDGMNVCCGVTDNMGRTAVSDPALLTLMVPPLITGQPQDVSTEYGEEIRLSVKAGGDDLRFQWYRMKKGAVGWALWQYHDTATTYAEANDAMNGTRVFCRVTDEKGASSLSEVALVTVE